jgi:hypothetical protein
LSPIVSRYLPIAMLVHRLTSGVAIAAYLWATTASGLLHDHDLHGPHLHDHNHETGRADLGTHQSQQERHAEHEHESPAPVDDDDCAACQFVGQLSLPVAVAGLILSPGIVTEIRELAPNSWFDVSFDRPRSRGPPV